LHVALHSSARSVTLPNAPTSLHVALHSYRYARSVTHPNGLKSPWRKQATACMEDGIKPDPAPLNKALKALKSKTALMFGDTVDDCRAAVAAAVSPFSALHCPPQPHARARCMPSDDAHASVSLSEPVCICVVSDR